MNNELSETSRANLASQVSTIVRDTPVFDIHTHLYDPAFGSLLLYGIDDLLTYHYLVAEVFRYTDVPYETFWKLTKIEQADLVWDHLFIQHSPISEACRGVLTTLNKLGLDVRKRDLPLIRKWYSEQTPHSFVDRCLELANVNKICMTNSPFDPIERPVWEKGFSRDERFVGGLRIDPLLLEWPNAMAQLQDDGHSVQAELNDSTISGIRHFLSKWSQTYQAQYLMVSLPPSFQYPSEEPISTILDQAVIPHCIENNQPLALMIGVKRAVNPQLSLAGDGMGRADLEALENLCRQHPEANF
ncbi:glucuronate isomerase, partial [Verrucomicrobia bacterium]|nr:glucuronate isomerase [Verrucomicrobiota bacterium]